MAAPIQLEEGSILNGRYLIVRPLGHGGMGTVYLARHERLDTEVAVKEIRGQHTNDEEFKATLEQCSKETRFMTSLHHPNLPKVSDAFVENDRFYLVMEYIEGVTLEAKLWENGSKPLDVKSVVEWGLQIVDVLAYLHSQEPPIIFRDLKPANIMLQPDNNVRLIDFGIARRFQPGASKDTMLLGSVGYSPPEQFGRHQTDTRSDIYALGATLHQLLTGRDPSQQPFKFPPARSINLAVPENLSRLLERCLAIEADGRPRSVREVAYELLMIRDELARLPQGAFPGGSSRDTHPSGGAKSVSGRPSVSGKGSSSGQRPQSGNQDPYPYAAPMSGGQRMGAGEAPPERRNLLLAVSLVLLVAVLGTATALFFSLPHTTPVPTPTPTPTPLPTPNPTPTPVPGPEPPAPAEITGTIKEDSATILPDPNKSGYWLEVTVSGTAKGKPLGSWMVVAFFVDGQGNMLMARDPSKGNFATDKGQLSVSQTITPGPDGQFSGVKLDIPSAEFPTTAPTTGARYFLEIFVDKQKVAETPVMDLPANIPADFFPTDASSVPSTPPSAPSTGVGVSGGNR